MKRLNSLVCLLVWLLFGASAAYAQGVGASGEINGTVTDPTGAVVPKVSVVAVASDRAISRGVTSDDRGQYRITGLPPATYEVTAKIAGFGTEIQKGVIVAVGETTVLDFHLKVATTAAEVVVNAEPPVVETERGSQADAINLQYISDLPIDRRDYLTFTLLMPGVSNSTRIASDQDFRVKQTPQSGLSFYGSNGRGNTVTVDGGEANDDAGGVRLNLGQDAVQEFQINRSNYSADLGSASGASINIVSKSGTNDIHGSLFGYFRNDALDARDPFAFSSALAPDPTFTNFNTTSEGLPIKNSLSRQQYGGSVGGPVQKDKTFFFLSFEGLRQDSQNSVPLLTDSSIFAGPSIAGNTLPANVSLADPRVAQQAIIQALAGSGAASVPCLQVPGPGNSPPTTMNLPPAECAFALQGLLEVNPNSVNPFVTANPLRQGLNGFLVSQFENNGGVFPYNTRQYLFSARLDHRIDSANQVFLRYTFGHDLEQSPDVESLTGFDAGSSIHTYDDTIEGSWFHQFSPSMQNELRLQWDYNDGNFIPNEPAQPNLNILGFANNLGTNIFLPDLNIMRRYEIADNVTMIRGHHTIKFGGYELLRGYHVDSHTFFPGRFVFGELPGAVLSICLQFPTDCGLSGALTPAGITALQSAALGAPELYQQGFGNPATYKYAGTRPWTAGYVQDSWAIAPNFTLNYGLRYEVDGQYAPLNTYAKNFGPRVSIAWDPFKDHKTVVRAGYGIFYAPIYNQIPGVDYSLGVLNANKSATENHGAAGSQVGNLVAACGIGPLGPPLPPNLFAGNGSSPCNRPISIFVEALPPVTGVNTMGSPGFNSAVIFSTLFAEGAISCTTPAAGQAACITPALAQPLLGFNPANINSGQIDPLQVLFVNQPNFRNPDSQQASLGIEREVAPGFSISASYIYSHTQHLPVAIDTNVLANPIELQTLQLANGQVITYRDFSPSAPFDPLSSLPGFPAGKVAPCSANPFLCYVNPFIAQNNQYSSAAYALYQAGILEVKKRFSNHFSLIGNYTYSKAIDTSTDFNSDYGPQDPTNLNLERAVSDFDQRHAVTTAGIFESPWKGKVLSGFALSPIVQYHSGHPFNLLSGTATNGDGHPTTGRPLGAPRDTGLGPNYVDFDMRLSWKYKIGEKSEIQLSADGFNILNRTNYGSVNNEVGPFFGFIPGFTTFNVHGSAALSPSTPLGFTSDFPKREIQLGARFTF
ncbi:MAG TPA: carboxypeptidase regulatory-like domain-containing protein [Candidatus Sulfotelmatobacter sp.]|nr:carboxypeptidase regulatory-like domain-containing protein [Candidatus Sulfotelmatobacter sp.]